jgi:hypothetical protein
MRHLMGGRLYHFCINGERCPSPGAVGESQKKLAESHSALLHQRGSALADFLKCRFEATKLLRAQFREHSLHLPGMLSKAPRKNHSRLRKFRKIPGALYAALDPCATFTAFAAVRITSITRLGLESIGT